MKDAWDEEEAAPPPPKSDTTKKATTAAISSKTIKDIKEMTEEEKKEAQMKADLEHTAELFGKFFKN